MTKRGGSVVGCSAPNWRGGRIAQDGIRFYCGTGAQAGLALDILNDAGFTNVSSAGRIDQARELKASQEATEASESP